MRPAKGCDPGGKISPRRRRAARGVAHGLHGRLQVRPMRDNRAFVMLLLLDSGLSRGPTYFRKYLSGKFSLNCLLWIVEKGPTSCFTVHRFNFCSVVDETVILASVRTEERVSFPRLVFSAERFWSTSIWKSPKDGSLQKRRRKSDRSLADIAARSTY